MCSNIWGYTPYNNKTHPLVVCITRPSILVKGGCKNIKCAMRTPMTEPCARHRLRAKGNHAMLTFV